MPLRRFLYGILVAAALLWIAVAAAINASDILSSSRTIWAVWHTDMTRQDCATAGGAMATAECEDYNSLIDGAEQNYALAIAEARRLAAIVLLPGGGLLLTGLVLRWSGSGPRRGAESESSGNPG